MDSSQDATGGAPPSGAGRPAHPLRGLLVTQFLGAFNDNCWKMVVAWLLIRQVTGQVEDGGLAFEAASQRQTMLAFVVFTLPLMLVSLPAGGLADRLSKRTVILLMKGLEVVLMAAGAGALFLQPAGGGLALGVLGLMGAQSAVFGPAKYGILPELLPHDRLSRGNALLEMWTIVAIVGGTGMGGVLLEAVGARVWLAGAVLTGLALVGLGAAWTIPRVPPVRAPGGLAATVGGAWRAVGADRVLRLAVIGSVVFYTVASLFNQNLVIYAKAVLRLTDSWAAAPMVALAVGVGMGSLAAGRLSAAKVETGLLPLGAAGMAVFAIAMGALGPGVTGSLVLLTLLGGAGGLLLVPLLALVQWRAPADRRGAIIALMNVFVFGGILAGSVAAYLLAQAGISSRGIFLVAGAVLVAGTAWALWLVPEALLRLVLVLLTHTVYRVRVIGRGHVPETGGALLVPNHVSFVDGLFLLATTDRPVRFIVDAAYFHQPLLKPFMRALGAIPISAAGGPRVVLRALRDAGRYLDAGELVCIFAEGQITRTGTLLPFRRGLERIVKGRVAPVIPVHLDQVWGSVFSRAGGRFLTKWPARIPYPVTVSFGAPLPAGTPIAEIRRGVQELGAEAWIGRKPARRPLHHTFVRTARRRPFRLALADAARPRVSRIGALAGSVALARALRTAWAEQPRVGVLLPPSVPGALVNLAAALCGRTSVNLNYTAGRAALASAVQQADLQTVVTSRQFLEKAGVELPAGARPVWIEEVGAGIGIGARLWALLVAWLAPIRLLERGSGAFRRPAMDDVATIIFSSGSTGEPKGVGLTHFNLDANVEGVAQVFNLQAEDRILGILPFFHSFGYTATLWLAANRGMGVVFHPNPLDAVAVGELVARYRITFLVATPTFLQVYLRRCDPGQFGSLRAVLAGAEKLPERLATAFEERFGLRPLEGYGTTECAPVVAVGIPGFRAPGFFQAGARRGSVGQPLPGVTVRVVDPDRIAESLDPLPPETPGMLVVKGPNVMQGYLGRDDLTAQVIRDGWYVTGDIAVLDEDGFIRITDRLSRFSKIGGEMVPHGTVEEALQKAAGEDQQVFAVTAVPDERKGERLAVLHTLPQEEIPRLLATVAAAGLPNLFIPRREHFIKVDALPVLGTGKTDLRAVKRIAGEALTPSG